MSFFNILVTTAHVIICSHIKSHPHSPPLTPHPPSSPPSRRGGAANAGSAGDPSCALLDGPCPAANPAGAPTQAYFVGDEIYMNMLKNADHFNAPAPGNFSAYLWDAKGNSKLLGSTRDTNAPSLSQYRVRGSLTGVAAGNYTIQTVYYTNNAQAPPAFFQCSDVTVLGANAESVAKVAHSHTH